METLPARRTRRTHSKAFKESMNVGGDDDQHEADAAGDVVALLHFGGGAKQRFGAVYGSGAFVLQLHFHDRGNGGGYRFDIHYGDVADDDARGLHRRDAALHGGGGQIDLFGNGTLRRLVVALDDAQDGAIVAVEHGLHCVRFLCHEAGFCCVTRPVSERNHRMREYTFHA